MAKPKINEKQKRFADFYIKTLNATESAKKAGYSEKTAYSQGERLLKNVEVNKYIQKRLEKASNKRIAEIEEVLEFYTETMRGNVTEQKVVKDDMGNVERTESTVKASDRLRAADSLSKTYALFTERVEHGGKVKVEKEFDFSNLSDEELQELQVLIMKGQGEEDEG